MNIVEKRNYIQNHLDQLDESLINQFYETLCKEEVLRKKLISRANKSENNILEGKVFSRGEIEQKTNVIHRQ